MVEILGRQDNIEEKPTVMLDTKQTKTKTMKCKYITMKRLVITYDNSPIEPYK